MPWLVQERSIVLFDALLASCYLLLCSLHSLTHSLTHSHSLYLTPHTTHTMSRRYDQSTTTFSPEGRLHQVEYAIEAINNAGTCVGLQSSAGIVLAAERRTVSKLLAPSKTSEKTYVLDDHVSCLVAGLTADANILIHQSRLASQR